MKQIIENKLSTSSVISVKFKSGGSISQPISIQLDETTIKQFIIDEVFGPESKLSFDDVTEVTITMTETTRKKYKNV